MITDVLKQQPEYTTFLYFAFVSVPLVLFCLTSSGPGLYKGFPAVGVDDRDGRFGRIDKARKRWMQHGASIVQEGFEKVGLNSSQAWQMLTFSIFVLKFPKCFQVVTGAGPRIVLSGRYADEIRNEPNLDFRMSNSIEFFGGYPGFEPFSLGEERGVTTEMVKGRLTQSLNYITEDLARETSSAIHDLCGQPTDWTEIRYKQVLLQLIARVTSRAFVGPELATNREWLDVSVNYTVQAFIATQALHDWPSLLRPAVHFFLPECREVRRTMARARRILEPVVARRRACTEQQEASAGGGSTSRKVTDTIGWMDEVAKGKPYDVVVAQIGLAFASIHSTSELLSGIISDLCSHPEWFHPLREEILAAIGTHGWSKKALNEMKTVDSMMKESQRHHTLDISKWLGRKGWTASLSLVLNSEEPGVADVFFCQPASMHRYATQAVTLSDGVHIPKGSHLMVGLDRMYDRNAFPDSDPAAFDPERFLRLRQQPGQENKWNFVTTSPDHLVFGHGKHSCPGRFFAANEVKIILAYLLVSFDWDTSAEGFKADVFNGVGNSSDRDAKAMIRLRENRGILL